MWIIMVWQQISQEVTLKGFKTCFISHAMMELIIYCGMAAKRMGMFGV